MIRLIAFACLVLLVAIVNIGAAIAIHITPAEASDNFGFWLVGAADAGLVGVAWPAAGELARAFGGRP